MTLDDVRAYEQEMQRETNTKVSGSGPEMAGDHDSKPPEYIPVTEGESSPTAQTPPAAQTPSPTTPMTPTTPKTKSWFSWS